MRERWRGSKRNLGNRGIDLDNFTTFAARQLWSARHLEQISQLESVTRERKKKGEKEKRKRVKSRSNEGGAVDSDSLLCYSPPSLCLNYVSF